ncbi:crossover junction endonuclease EME1B-like [Alnus glutinosa]|uniref:crossover junction endonuclease EME1B-like n=1 Tax=Alnus glutinosa TaxID=3517 RepID=UPI002D786831|nr:crossover junction endonuclease EME1B-like [Alnus glutinosa]
MPQPILLSDDEEENGLSTPVHISSKKQRRFEPDNPAALVLLDDPTPKKPGPTSTPSFVPETPMSASSSVAIVKCTTGSSHPQIRVSDSQNKFSGICGLICLESDNESESGPGREKWKENETMGTDFDASRDSDWSSRINESTSSLGNDNIMRMFGDSSLHSNSLRDDVHQVYDHLDKDNVSMEQINDNVNQKRRTKVDAEKKSMMDRAMGRKKMTQEERIHLMEEKKLKKEQEKLQKAAQKAEAAEMKKLQKEKQKWEKGKFALKSIVAEIDAKVIELGSVGGHLLTRFAEKGLTYRITSNPIERSIVWTMTVPEHISQISSNGMEIPYILFVYEAEEFCNLVINESLLDHVSSVRSRYPSYTICCLTSRLMSYINKREQEKYKNPSNNNGWSRPPVEEVMAKLTTHFSKVHSRQCMDEAELAEHVVGLTSSLASCQYRKKLTRLSVNANGSVIPKDAVDRNLIKKNLWLKALISIPKVQPRFATAIWKKYPTMKSLLSVYMDPSKSVHEKEFLLKDLTTEGLLGEDRRLGEVCSKRVYRILMAQSGSIKTDDVENGADFFIGQSS